MGGDREQLLDAERSSKSGKRKAADGAEMMSPAGAKLRVHQSGGEVHFHDDAAGVKAALYTSDWWRAWETLRGQPDREFRHYDGANQSLLVVRTQAHGQGLDGIDVQISITKVPVGANYQKLAEFTNPSPRK